MVLLYTLLVCVMGFCRKSHRVILPASKQTQQAALLLDVAAVVQNKMCIKLCKSSVFFYIIF